MIFIRSLVLTILIAISFSGCNSGENKQQLTPSAILEKKNEWIPYFQENAVNKLLQESSHKFKPSTVAFTNVNLISMEDASVRKNKTVVIENGKFSAIGNSGEVTIPTGATRIDGTGQYLIPGLTDMHIHSLVSNSQKLLNLACGVTTVRDMDGFPWLLKERDMIAKNAMLGPTVYQTGQILNYNAMDYYARVIKTSEEARAAVRADKEAGYDFIKVHNNVPPEIYAAICDEAKTLSIDVVGHIPHRVTLQQAIASGQRTFEHMKGYYSDRTLEMTTEDYMALTKGADVWNCPTFYTRRIGESKNFVTGLLTTEEAKYAPALDRKRWLANAPEHAEENGQKIFNQSKKIFSELLTINAKFIAGTDCGGGYGKMIPGFALLDEIETMESFGMTPFQALQSATINAALAMRKEKEFGTIAVGKRADCVLLPGNPLENIKSLRSNNGVMVRGIWLSKNDIAGMLKQIEDLYSEEYDFLGSDPVHAVTVMPKEYNELRMAGFCGRRDVTEHLGRMLIELGMTDDATTMFSYQKEDFPAMPDGYLNLAEVYSASGKKSLAEKECEQVLKIDPANEKAKEILRSIK